MISFAKLVYIIEGSILRVVSASSYGGSAVCDVHFAMHASYTEECQQYFSDRFGRLEAVAVHMVELTQSLATAMEALCCSRAAGQRLSRLAQTVCV